MARGRLTYLLIVAALGTVGHAFGQPSLPSARITMSANGSIAYHADALGNTIPDFSKVGYYQNRKPLPTVPVVKTIEASGNNSQQALQSAIDELSAKPLDKNGFRGAILLKKGVYHIAGTIKIAASGIVLRGEGDETIIVATGKGQRSLLSVRGAGQLKEIKGSRQRITNNYVPVGATSFVVSTSKGFKVGDSIVVFRPGTQQWIHDLKMDQIEARDSTTKQWAPAEYDLHFERVITRITGDRIFIDNPIVMAMETTYGGGYIYKYSFAGRINNVGIENLVCQSEYASDTDEDHGWNAVHLNNVQNAWVQNVTAVYFGYSCVNLADKSRNITVLNCKYLQPKSKVEGGRRYSFTNDGQLNLFMHCSASEGRHDYVTGARVCGPNVFYNCTAINAKADIGPHHRWAMGTLYDNITTDGAINAQDRGNWGTGHGWSGVNQVFWNCSAAEAAIQNPWVSGKNYIIGMKANKKEGRLPNRIMTEWEGVYKDASLPISLYESQLKDGKKRKKKNWVP